jgi:hypothetical protein
VFPRRNKGAKAVHNWPSLISQVDVDFHHKGISAIKPLVTPVGKSSLSHGGEESLASRWAPEPDVGFSEQLSICSKSYKIPKQPKRLTPTLMSAILRIIVMHCY